MMGRQEADQGQLFYLFNTMENGEISSHALAGEFFRRFGRL